MAGPVTDPALLAQLNGTDTPAAPTSDLAPGVPKAVLDIGRKKVTDPAILAQLNGTQPATVGDRADELRAAVPPEQPSLVGSAAATANGIVNGIPVVGPAITKASDFILAQTLGRLEGQDPADFM